MSLIADALKKAQAAKIGRRYLTTEAPSVGSLVGGGGRAGLRNSLDALLSRINLSTTLWVGLGSGMLLFVLLFFYFFSGGGAVRSTPAASAAASKKELVLTPPPKVVAVEPSSLEKREGSLTKELLVPTEREWPVPRETARSIEDGERTKTRVKTRREEISKRSASLGPTDLAEQVRYHFNLALFYQEASNFPQAGREYEKVLQMWPFYAEAHNNLGVVYKELGRYDQAIASLQKALALNPKYVRAFHNLGAVYQLKRDLKQARKNYESALTLDRSHLPSYNNLGLVLREERQLHEARELLEKALTMSPSYSQTHYNLALVLEELGELERARFHYQKFVELAGDENRHLAARVRAHLQELAVK